MRIKKIELVGFKSFCDKTTIVFNDDMTAIVGPNGCGKSNVVDALRWVMGSKSAKQLRGASMEDVIFAGTETRGPLGMAEVTFTLDLSDGVAPPQYAGYQEVEVTRRLFRDGTSEYAIQKIPCRLQDVRELFLGTGVGHYAYAIIEQGRVGEIVSSKPETRRQFIEEAAGITKYKDKKRKAELKMASTRQNLLRINDIVSELESSMRRLWRAAKKAERYEAYRDEVADLDKWRLAQRLLENLSGRRLANDQLEMLSGSVTQVDALIAEREGTLAAGRLDLRDLEVTLSDRQSELSNLDNRVKLLEAQLEHKRQEISQLRRRHDLDEAESKRLQESIQQYEHDLEETRNLLQSLEVEHGGKKERLQEWEDELSEARSSQAEVDDRVEEYRDRAGRAETRIATLEADQRSASQRIEESSTRLDMLASQERELANRARSLEPRVEELKQRIDAGQTDNQERETRRVALTDRLETLQQSVSRLEVELDTARGQLHRSRSRLSSLEEIQRRYEGFQQGTRAIMENGQNVVSPEAIHGLLADKVEAPAEYEAAVEAVLGDRLGAILVEDANVGVEAVSYLKEGNRGRSCFLPMGADAETGAPGLAMAGFESANDSEIIDPAVRGMMLDLVNVDGEFRGVAGRLLEDVLVVDDLEQALRVWRTQRTPRTVVTLDGEVVDPYGLISGGSADAQTAGILAQKREIRELTEICADLERHYNELHERLVQNKQESRSTEEELDGLRRAIHESEMSLLGDTKDLESAQSQLGESRQRLEAAQTESQRLETLVEDLTRRESQSRRELDGLFSEQSEAQEQLSLGLTEAERERQRVNQLAGEAAELKVTVARSAEQRNTCQRDLGRLKSDIDRAQQRLVELRDSAKENSERVVTLEGEIAEGDEERLEVSSQAMDLGEQVSEEAGRCDARRVELDEFEAGLKALRGDRRAASEERESLRMRVLELDKDWEHLEDRLEERHHAGAQEVLHDFHLRPVFDEELQARLDKQSRLLDSLRNTYNPGARQEYEELSERHSFLSEQKADLDEALERLDKAIQKINKTSRARFRAAFEGINQEFTAVFPRLFKGGKARLELTQSNDILLAGVDIVAQPPGKKLQSVDIMSGGEKALTAVALLFSIFKYKPSPFCLLDEVDAPLDDANVDRFNEQVREMAQETQFVLITHNKRTMALADSLYGVTMEQAGCSKVVAVNFKEASRMVDDPPPGPAPTAPSPASDGSPSGGAAPARPANPDSAAN